MRIRIRGKPVKEFMRKVENSHPQRDPLRPLCPQGDEQTDFKFIFNFCSF